MVSEGQHTQFMLVGSIVSYQPCRDASGRLFLRVALQLVEFNTVQPFEALVTELTCVVVVGLWSVFLHVPVEGRSLAALVATDLTSDDTDRAEGTTEDLFNLQQSHSCESVSQHQSLTVEVFLLCESACEPPGDSYA